MCLITEFVTHINAKEKGWNFGSTLQDYLPSSWSSTSCGNGRFVRKASLFNHVIRPWTKPPRKVPCRRPSPNPALPLEGCTPNAQVQDGQKDYSEDVGYLTMKTAAALIVPSLARG